MRVRIAENREIRHVRLAWRQNWRLSFRAPAIAMHGHLSKKKCIWRARVAANALFPRNNRVGSRECPGTGTCSSEPSFSSNDVGKNEKLRLRSRRRGDRASELNPGSRRFLARRREVTISSKANLGIEISLCFVQSCLHIGGESHCDCAEQSQSSGRGRTCRRQVSGGLGVHCMAGVAETKQGCEGRSRRAAVERIGVCGNQGHEGAGGAAGI